VQTRQSNWRRGFYSLWLFTDCFRERGKNFPALGEKFSSLKKKIPRLEKKIPRLENFLPSEGTANRRPEQANMTDPASDFGTTKKHN
jgi:hypothetical protein